MRFPLIFLILVAVALCYADIDSKDSISITTDSSIDGVTVGVIDGQTITSASSGPAEKSLTASANLDTWGADPSFATLAIGTAAADRVVVVAGTFRSAVEDTSFGMTIGGETATVFVSKNTDTTHNFHTFLGWATVTTGTTATVAFTSFSASTDPSWIELDIFRLVGASATAEDTDSANGTASPSVTLTTTIGGIVIAAATHNAAGPAADWTGGDLTEDTDRQEAEGEYEDNHTVASMVATGTSQTASVVLAGAGTQYASLAAVSWTTNQL